MHWQVLVDVQYCALNASDALLTKNMYTFEPTLPMVLGYEFVGKLIQVGEEAKGQGYKVGDKVIALNKDRYGGLAEQCIADVNVSEFLLLNRLCLYFTISQTCRISGKYHRR